MLGSVPAASVRRLATWVRSGPSAAAGAACRGSCGTSTQGAVDERPAGRAAARRVGRLGRAAARCAAQPGVELVRRARRRREAPCARAGGRRTRRTGRGRRPGRSACSQSVVVVARDQVLLAVQVRHPEAVDHVVASAASSMHRPADRDVDLVGGGDAAARRRVLVLDLPPPLVAGDLDRQSVRRAGSVGDARGRSTTLATSRTNRMTTVSADGAADDRGSARRSERRSGVGARARRRARAARSATAQTRPRSPATKTTAQTQKHEPPEARAMRAGLRRRAASRARDCERLRVTAIGVPACSAARVFCGGWPACCSGGSELHVVAARRAPASCGASPLSERT